MLFSINNSYNFATLAPAVLGNSISNAQLIGILNYETASKISDVYTLHSKLKSTINNLPDVTSCTFLQFKNTITGSSFIMANEYINQATVVAVSSLGIRIDITNVNNSDIAILRTILEQHGYNSCVFTIIQQ